MIKLLILFVFVLSGCQSEWKRTITYNNGLKIEVTDTHTMQENCHIEDQYSDNKHEVLSKTQLGGCYDRRVEPHVIRASFEYITNIIHEFCHYFCDTDKDVSECDKNCKDIHY